MPPTLRNPNTPRNRPGTLRCDPAPLQKGIQKGKANLMGKRAEGAGRCLLIFTDQIYYNMKTAG
jgi:hypothetical protein